MAQGLSIAMFEFRVLFILIAIVILEPTHQHYQRSVPQCETNGQRFCSSCSTASSCVYSLGSLKRYNTVCSAPNPMCGLDTSTPPKFVCTSNVADCTCKSTGGGLSYQKDPYSDQWYIVCSTTSTTYVNCGDGNFYNEAGHNCVNYPPPLPSTTTPQPSICAVLGPGVHDDPSSCESYFICTAVDAKPINGMCDGNGTTYFDPDKNECQTRKSLFQCPPAEFGTFADPFDCRRYYVCFDGELLEYGCCDPSQVFSKELENCTDGPAPEECPLSVECAM